MLLFSSDHCYPQNLLHCAKNTLGAHNPQSQQRNMNLFSKLSPNTTRQKLWGTYGDPPLALRLRFRFEADFDKRKQ